MSDARRDLFVDWMKQHPAALLHNKEEWDKERQALASGKLEDKITSINSKSYPVNKKALNDLSNANPGKLTSLRRSP